ncbi:adenylosuccinate lyase [Candidatus Gottesmanbacteria bacterium]|nr:adenylosuccinate lyase [Candidatus Gottesmanbacteria bacterium]
MIDFSNYQSVFSWRYGSSEMRKLLSLEHRFKTWRKIWVGLAKAQWEKGIIKKSEYEDLKKQQNNIDLEKIFEIEKITKHDVVAAIREFAGKAKKSGGKIHLGLTSMDVVDNGDVLIAKQALSIIQDKIISLLKEFNKQIKKYHDFVCIGFTHLQPAEPTTVGYRISFYAQDLLIDLEFLNFIKIIYKGKGIKGAVGTGASFKRLTTDSISLESKVMKQLGIDSVDVSSQVVTRKFDFLILTFLASVSSSVSKFAEDLRILQSPTIGEWSEPFGKTQVGSSAMPFKKNPVNSEKICSLARYVAQLPNVVLQNATLSHLERTLDDSANRRIVVPESFLAVDEILDTAIKIASGMIINTKNIQKNLNTYAPFSAIEIIIAEVVKKGADRQKVHEEIRVISMQAWDAINQGRDNPIKMLIEENKYIRKYLKKEEIRKLNDVKGHIGDVSVRSLRIANKIDKLT